MRETEKKELIETNRKEPSATRLAGSTMIFNGFLMRKLNGPKNRGTNF
ncbi:MAG: hypothetical protein ABR985_01225 [Methanotrichaceae archaeon]